MSIEKTLYRRFLRNRESRLTGEKEFRAIFEQTAIGMARISFTDVPWIDVNDAFCRMLGLKREILLATRWPEITHPHDVERELVPFRRMAVGELDTYTIEKRFVHKLGRHVWAQLTISLVRDAKGRPDYAIAIIEDISGRKQVERGLQESEPKKKKKIERNALKT